MEREEAIAIIRKEYLCVDRDCGIEKNCGKCDLVMPSKEPILEAFKMAIKALEQEAKWERLYSWLNDMRLGIAPDETITDIDERNARIAQTDILDEIMEWLPSVKPQYTDAEIQKMQELEQAEIEKSYEIGKDEGSDVLDKIRAEIMSKDGLEEALEIIDKYRAEREEEG